MAPMWFDPNGTGKMFPGLRQGPAVSAYLGQVATRTFLPQQAIAGNKQLNSRSAHIARDNLAAVAIAVPNWCALNGSNGEVFGSASATVFASIEYPAGTFTRILWNGSASVSIPAGSTGVSDVTPLSAPIPSGAQFWVRTFWTNADGIFISYGAGFSENAAAGDALAVAGSGLSDQTMGGTISDNNSYGYGVAPAAILGMTTKPSVALIGDSRVYGQGDSNDATLDRGELARSIGPTLAYMNLGTCADRAAWWIANNTRRLALARYCSHAILQFGTNDFFEGSRTAVQLLADRQTALSQLAGLKVFETTVSPETDVGNTATRDATNDASRLSANASIRAGGRGFAGMFDIASAIEASSLWGQNSFHSGDGIHESQGGYLAIQNSGSIDARKIVR